MKKVLLLSFNVLLAVLIACQPVGQSMVTSMLKPGDEIDSMVITTGSAKAPPLWAFCSLIQQRGNAITSHCNVPPMLPTLAIGHVFMVADEALTDLDWSEFTWKLLVDEQPIDLDRFGTYHFTMPTMSANPSPVREVFKTITAWDVVLTNLNPGAHMVQGLAQCETDTYTWIVNLRIEAPYAFDFGSTP